MDSWCGEDLAKSPEKVLRRRKAGLKTGKFGGGFGRLLIRRLQKDGQRAMPQLTPNVQYAKHFSVELSEIDGIDEKIDKNDEIAEIDERKSTKTLRSTKKSTKTTKSNDEIDEKMGCYVGLKILLFSFVKYFRQLRRFFRQFRRFRRFRRFRKVWGGHHCGPFFRDSFRTSLRGWGGGWGSGFGVRGVGKVTLVSPAEFPAPYLGPIFFTSLFFPDETTCRVDFGISVTHACG